MSLGEATTFASRYVSKTKHYCKRITLQKPAGSGQSGHPRKRRDKARPRQPHGPGLCRNPHRRRRPGRPDHERHAEPTRTAHLVLERGRIAERWRSERWDGLRFQFPNWSVRLPDWPFPHADPHGFATSAEIVDYLEAYARKIRAAVRCGVTVTALRKDGFREGYIAELRPGPIKAEHVVIASGPYQKPFVPDLSVDQHDLLQIHASSYKAPSDSHRERC